MIILSALLICLAVVLSTATQFRFGSFGVGEVLGGLGIAGVLIAIRTVQPIAVSYLSGVCAITVGMVLGMLTSVSILDGEFRALDFWAMLYAQLIAFAVLAISWKTGRPALLVLPALLAFPIIQMCLLGLSFFGYTALPLWFSGEEDGTTGIPFASRFMGWSTNPNQLGISLAALPFWLLFFLGEIPKLSVRYFIVVALLATAACGFLVNSNTVYLAWIGGGLVLAAGFSWRRLSRTPLVLPLIILAMIVIVGTAVNFLPTLLEKGSEGDFNGRIPIWITSLESWAASPLFGLGPGPHAIDPWDGVAAESHLLLLDFLTQGGIVAMGGLIYLFWLSFRHALRSAHVLAVAGVVALFVETLAHNTQRHPMFWVYLVLPMVLFVRETPSRQSMHDLIESTN